MFDFFKNAEDNIQKQWFSKGENYAIEINKMVEFGELHGWENWKGTEPFDDRSNIIDEVLERLKKANKKGDVSKFRELFPPAHAPLAKILENKGQSIEQICFIEHQKVIFLTGSNYQDRKAFILDNNLITKLDENIVSVGKSKRNNIFAFVKNNVLTTTKGWQGEKILEIKLQKLQNVGFTNMIPFNNGLKVLVITSIGIYILSAESEKLIYPVPDPEDSEWTSDIDMENATLSNDNKYIVVGEQSFDHHILNSNGEILGTIGPQSSYPHFCLFSKDDSQLITNSCHFYNGITIGIDATNLEEINIEAYESNDKITYINEEMRVYAGVSVDGFYVLGDAYGYIKAIDKNGKQLWRHYLGSTISSIEISLDEKYLWVGTHAGILHKITLGKKQRDTHTIGNGDLYEDFRMIIWKDEPNVWIW